LQFNEAERWTYTKIREVYGSVNDLELSLVMMSRGVALAALTAAHLRMALIVRFFGEGSKPWAAASLM